MKILNSIAGIALASALSASPGSKTGFETATFAGGCFWCVQPPFDTLQGVVKTEVGYTGGKGTATYEDYAEKGHLEAVRVFYDPSKVSYEELLDFFWKMIDPTDSNGQFVDRGPAYRPAIFWHSADQKKLAEASRKALAASGRFDKPIAVDILKAGEFYEAEEYHQHYASKNPLRYGLYRRGTGRDEFIKKSWANPDKPALKKRLSALQYEVTQACGTEPAFRNEYWDNHKEGIYVDVVSGEVLFSSKDKFDSGTGWPSFTKPLEPANVTEKADDSLFMARTEVRSKGGNSHLGHVFNDGPKPTGQRYCINSASLRFIPKQDLEKEGYGKYRFLFAK